METQYISQLHHKKVQIIKHDYSHLQGDDFAAAIERNAAETIANDQDALLILFDGTQVEANKKSLASCLRSAPKISKYVRRLAVVGISKIQVPFMDYVGKLSGIKVRFFDDSESAKDWLVE